MPGFDLEGAVAAGHSHADIAQHLASKRNFDVDGALRAGYSHEEIATHLSKDDDAGEKHDYSSTQVNMPDVIAKSFQRYAATIPDGKLAEDGRETEPHITLKYGLHTTDPAKVRQLLENEPPILVRLGRTSMFPASESGDADVLKIDIESADLRRLNKKVSDALPHTDTHPGYKPHATLAYLRAGEGKAFTGKIVPGVTGRHIIFYTVIFSGKDGNKTEIQLKKRGVTLEQQSGRREQSSALSSAGQSRPSDRSSTEVAGSLAGQSQR